MDWVKIYRFYLDFYFLDVCEWSGVKLKLALEPFFSFYAFNTLINPKASVPRPCLA